MRGFRMSKSYTKAALSVIFLASGLSTAAARLPPTDRYLSETEDDLIFQQVMLSAVCRNAGYFFWDDNNVMAADGINVYVISKENFAENYDRETQILTMPDSARTLPCPI